MAEDRSISKNFVLKQSNIQVLVPESLSNGESQNPRLKHSLPNKFRIMALMLGYPDNWTESATTVKQAAGYRCKPEFDEA